MKRPLYKHTLALSLIWVVLLSSHVFAQQDVAYTELGLRFKVPAGWVGQEGDGLYLMTHQTIPCTIVLMPHEATNRNELRAGTHEGLTYGDGSFLQPSGDIQDFGTDGIRLDMEGLVEWSPARAHAIALIAPHGAGVVVLAITSPDQFTDAYRTYAETVTRSIHFSKPVVPAIVKEWKQELRHLKLAYYNTTGGYDSSSSSKEVITLCDGYFTYYSSYSGYGNNLDGSGVSAAGNSSYQGTWEVVSDMEGGAILKLYYEDGDEASYNLAYEGEKVYLNDSRYLRSDGNCQ